jgi:phosphohistidine phosphatase SixA
MQKLMILRHAKAVPWYPGVEDFNRPLSDIGTGHAGKVANWMCKRLDAPDSILCSPSQRTRETLSPLLSQNPGLESVTRYEPDFYGASTGALHAFLDLEFAESDRILIVGHNPGFEMLVFDVIAHSEYDKIRRLATGTLVVVDFESGWETGSGKGILRHKVRGKKL